MKKLVSLTVAILSGAAICAALSVSPVGVLVSDAQAATICGGSCPGISDSRCQNCSGWVKVCGSGGYGEQTQPGDKTGGAHCCSTYCFDAEIACQ